MRLATVEYQGAPRCGVVTRDGLHLLPAAVTVAGLLAGGPEALEQARRDASSVPAVPLEQVRLLPPLAPPTVRDFVAFEEHVEGVRRSIDGVGGVVAQWYEAPTFYFTNPYAVIGAHDDVPVPPGSQVLDFELEVAAVIGREGRDLTPEQARDHIVGYTIFNDWSARDLQMPFMKANLGPAGGKDFANSLGPCIVTPDELVDPYALRMSARVNGETWSDGSTSTMHHSFEDAIGRLSDDRSLVAGEVIGSGTVLNGCGLEIGKLLSPGDVVELEVEGIGVLRNRIALT